MPKLDKNIVKFSEIQSYLGVNKMGDAYSSSQGVPVSGPISFSSFLNNTTPAAPAAWYDATAPSTITRDGTNLVSQWDDKTANAYHLTQATSANRPTYSSTGFNSRPCLTMGAQNGMSRAVTTMGTLATSSSFTYFAVLENGAPNFNISGSMYFSSTGSLLTNRFYLALKNNTTPVHYMLVNGVVQVNSGRTDDNYRYVSGFVYGGAYQPSYATLNGTQVHWFPTIDLPTVTNTTHFFIGDVRTELHRSPPKISEVIMYPRAITMMERLNTEQYLREKWALLPLDTLSSTALANLRGAYALVRLLTAYTGPVVRVRRDYDESENDFYADLYGNLTTFINGQGISIEEWLGTDVGYVTTWYDQSGNGRHATQSTLNSQPILDTANYTIDFKNNSASFLTMTNNPVPTGTLNAQYSFVVKHGPVNNTTNGGLIGSGTANVNNAANNLRFDNTIYRNYWWNNDYTFGTTVNTGATVTVTYNGTTRRGWVNGVAATTATSSGYTNGTGPQFLGKTVANEHLNGSLFYALIFGTALTDADRNICENHVSMPWYEMVLNGFPSFQRYDAMNIPSGLTTVSTWVSSHNDGGTGKNATGVNSPAYRVINNYPEVQFTRASSQHFTIPSLAYTWMNGNGGFSVAAVVKFTSTGAYERIFDFGTGVNVNSILLTRDSTTKNFNCTIFSSSGTVLAQVIMGNGIPDSDYHVFVWTVSISSAGTSLALYVDGAVQYTSTTATVMPNRTTTINYLGRSTASADAYFQGAMRELIFYKCALSQQEVATVVSALQAKWGMAQRYPPVAPPFTGTGLTESATITDQPHGNGTYSFAASSQYSTSIELPRMAFDMNSSSTVWTTTGRYNGSTGAYTGSVSTVVDGVSQLGEYLQLQLPYAISPRYIYLHESSVRDASSLVIAASNNGTTWTSLYDATGLAVGSGNYKYINLLCTSGAYSYYRVIARQINPANQFGFYTIHEFGVYGVPSAPFHPKQLPGLQNYYSADEGVTSSSGSVSAWADLSGHNRNASQVSGGTQPTLQLTALNGYPMINFSASSSAILSAAGATVGNVTVVIVGRTALKSTPGTILMTNNTTWTTDGFQIQVNANLRTINFDIFGNVNISHNTAGSFTDNVPFILVYTASIYNGTVTRTTRLNGAADNTTSTTISSTDLNFSSFTIGNFADRTRNMNGGLSAIAIYNSILSVMEIEMLEGFMAWKWWGSGVVLPTTHRFKNQPPTGYQTLSAPPNETPLYEFTQMTFTKCGVTTINTGPTLAQMQATYNVASGGGAWTQNTEYLKMGTQGVQIWTVPATGRYEFVVAGAAGGRADSSNNRGVIIIGEVILQKGNFVHIVVGQQGTGSSTTGSGGGGGSFVLLDGKALLLVAGGGGGSGRDWKYGGDAVLTIQGGFWPRFSTNAAGQTTPGSGGITTSSNSGAGGGFGSNGMSSPSGGAGGGGFLQGAVGASGTMAGGFGGGGAGFGALGGGGGGVTGGSGSDTRGANAGGGGGSYYIHGPGNTATRATAFTSGWCTGDGYVRATYLGRA